MANKIFDGDTSTVLSLAANWDADTLPETGDSAWIPSGETQAITGDIQAILLVDFVIQDGYTPTVGVVGTPITIDADNVELNGSGLSFIDIDNSTIVNVLGAGSALGTGGYNLNLSGAGNTELLIAPGGTEKVGIAGIAGDSAAFGIIRVESGDVEIGFGTTCTDLYVYGGTVHVRCALTDLNVYGGTVHVYDDVSTLWNIEGGVVYDHGKTVGDVCVNAYVSKTGKCYFGRYHAVRTFTNVNLWDGVTWDDRRSGLTLTNGIKINKTDLSGDDAPILRVGVDKTITVA